MRVEEPPTLRPTPPGLFAETVLAGAGLRQMQNCIRRIVTAS